MDKWKQGLKIVCLLCISFLLSACLSNTSYAPVVNAWQQPAAQKGTYVVHKGDTIYSIAWTFGLDYRALAAANNLKSPYAIRPGQRLRMQASPRRRRLHAIQSKIIKIYSAQQKQAAPQWVRPARGQIISAYSSNPLGNQGINIAGRLGEPIHAAASGKVVYSGDGIRGYGNLLLIKHNESYLSAYAFNKKNRVVLGQHVQAGQTIAEMGRNNAGRVMLHFEIRRNGKPVNPEHYIRS